VTHIVFERPPNFELILSAFPEADKPGVIFAYGDHIYNPSGANIPPALLAHEAVHQRDQLDMGVEKWWEKYLIDTEFRYSAELYAHVAEYRAQAPKLDRNARAKLLMSTASRLSAPLYNYQPPRSLSVAMRDLKWEIES
jgi:hypothetical protein